MQRNRVQRAVWLVTKWLPFHAEGYTKPKRMIRLDQFQHERLIRRHQTPVCSTVLILEYAIQCPKLYSLAI
jgi:hypothetical protein